MNTKSITKRYTVELVHLNKGGYDKHGRYFGVGQKLYCIYDNELWKHYYVRARSASEARREFLKNPSKWGG